MESESEIEEVNVVERQRRSVVKRNEEGIRLERLRMLKVSWSAYHGAIKRVRGRIEELMKVPTNKEAVEVERKSLHRTFVCYSKCCKDFIENLLLGEENERLETQTAELGKAAPDFIFLKDFAAPECCTTSSMYCAIFFEKLLPE